MHTFFGKTAAMIQSVEEMSHFQKVLLKIMFFLLGVSFILCGIILLYLLISGETVLRAISYVVVLLVASIPLAMEARHPPSPRTHFLLSSALVSLWVLRLCEPLARSN